MQAGLIGKCSQGLIQGLCWQVQLNLAGLYLCVYVGSGPCLQGAGEHGQGAAGDQGVVKASAATVSGLGQKRHE